MADDEDELPTQINHLLETNDEDAQVNNLLETDAEDELPTPMNYCMETDDEDELTTPIYQAQPSLGDYLHDRYRISINQIIYLH